MKKLFKTAVVMAAMLILWSCASIVSSSRWPLTVNSEPTGAKVSITDKKGIEVYNGITPATLELKSGAGYFAKAEYNVSIKMDGYEETVVPVKCQLNGWYFGNILLGGILGMLIIDPITGAMYKLDTDIISPTLTKSSTSEVPSLRILNYQDVSENMRQHLQRIN